MKKILVPVDGSELSNKAIKIAGELAKFYQSDLILLHVDERSQESRVVGPGQPGAGSTMSGTGAGSSGGGFTYFVSPEESGEEAEHSTFILNNARSQLPPLGNHLSTVALRGHAADAIERYVKDSDIDLIIIGSSAKTGFKRFFLGSVANKVATSTEKSVMIIR